MGRFADFYRSKAWQGARRRQLLREPTCRMCRDLGRLTSATVVDHIVRLADAWDRRLDPENLQSLCAPCHNGAKQSFERTGRLRGVDRDGFPVDPNHAWNRGGAGSKLSADE